jgi:hypothetical protein
MALGILLRRTAIKPIHPPSWSLLQKKRNTLTKTTNTTTKKTHVPNQNVIPTPEQIEKMRKQNEKFRMKRFKRSQVQEDKNKQIQ